MSLLLEKCENQKEVDCSKKEEKVDCPYLTIRLFSWLLLERLNARCF